MFRGGSGRMGWATLLVAMGCAGGGQTESDSASFGPGGPGGGSATATEGDSATSTSGFSSDGMTSQGPGNGPGGSGGECIDADGDSFGDGCPAGPDCNDDDRDINPGAAEVCDGVDQNCDDEIDNGCECDDDGISGDCNFPTDLGALAVGDQVLGVVGNIPQENAIDWYMVSFPLADARPGQGTPSISFSVNEDEAFVFDIVDQQCAADAQACTSGGTDGFAVGLTDWTFVDDDPGCCAPPMDSLIAWPDPIFVRVYRTTPGASCATYQLQLSR